MLGKLLKYEMKETSRFLGPMLLILIVIAFINKMFFWTDFDFSKNDNEILTVFKVFLFGVLVIAIVGVYVAALIVMILRFYRNLLGNEGYLMFTLPVKEYLHIIAKAVSAAIWQFICTLAIIISLSIIFINTGVVDDIKDSILELNKSSNGLLWVYAIEVMVTVVVSIFSGVLMIYASMALGHLVSKHRILASFGAYLGIYAVNQIVMTLLIWIIFGVVAITRAEVENYGNIMHAYLIGIVIYNLIAGIVYFIVTKIILEKKLNIE